MDWTFLNEIPRLFETKEFTPSAILTPHKYLKNVIVHEPEGVNGTT